MTDWPMTFRCNNNCVSCILNTSVTSSIPDPPMEQITRVIDGINPKNDYFGVSGGEPTLRNELLDILRYARERHPDLYIFLVSNGRMFFYREYTKKLADLNLNNFRVGIPLYGHTPKLHDSITRVKGSFIQAVGGIKNLLESGIKVEVRTIIGKLNYKHLEDTAKFVGGFQDIDRFVFINMKYTGNAFLHKNILFVKLSDVVPYATKAVDILRDFDIYVRLYHFPLCILPEEYRTIAEGVTKEEKELTFAPQCKNCKLRNKCPRIWKTYFISADKKEFKPIVD